MELSGGLERCDAMVVPFRVAFRFRLAFCQGSRRRSDVLLFLVEDYPPNIGPESPRIVGHGLKRADQMALITSDCGPAVVSSAGGGRCSASEIGHAQAVGSQKWCGDEFVWSPPSAASPMRRQWGGRRSGGASGLRNCREREEKERDSKRFQERAPGRP